MFQKVQQTRSPRICSGLRGAESHKCKHFQQNLRLDQSHGLQKLHITPTSLTISATVAFMTLAVQSLDVYYVHCTRHKIATKSFQKKRQLTYFSKESELLTNGRIGSQLAQRQFQSICCIRTLSKQRTPVCFNQGKVKSTA